MTKYIMVLKYDAPDDSIAWKVVEDVEMQFKGLENIGLYTEGHFHATGTEVDSGL